LLANAQQSKSWAGVEEVKEGILDRIETYKNVPEKARFRDMRVISFKIKC